MKQPRTKCKTNQHQKRGVPALRCVSFDVDASSVTYEYVKVSEKELAASTLKTAAELLGYTVGASYEWRPQR